MSNTETASSTGDVQRIAPSELERALEMAQHDLCFFADRIAAIQKRINPDWGLLDCYATALYTLNGHASQKKDEEQKGRVNE